MKFRLLPALLLGWLTAVGLAGEAQAGKLPTCTGTSLIEKSRTERPQEFQTALEAAAKVPNGDKVFWRIEGEGSRAASWLFGTIHLTDERVHAIPPEASEALAGARTLAVEVAEAAGPTEIAAAFAAKPRLISLPEGRDVFGLLSVDTGNRLKEKLVRLGADPARTGKLQPWLLATMFAVPQCEVRRVSGGLKRLDDRIIEQARARGTKVVGLERMQEQLEAVSAMPLDGQAAQLAAILDADVTPEDRQETLIQIYLTRRMGLIFPMLELAQDKQTAVAFRYFSETLIKKRNATMIERALPLLAEGGVFIAVGAAHMPGEQGLVELVRKAGYTVTPVD